MAIFNDTKQINELKKDIKSFSASIKQLETKTKELSKEIEYRTSDSEKEAKQSSRKAAEFRNKTEQRLTESNDILKGLKADLASANKLYNAINDLHSEADEYRQNIYGLKIKTEEDEKQITQKVELLNEKIDSLNAIFIQHPDLDSKIDEVEDFINKIDENFEKSGISLTSINKRKKEIDDLHREIFGYEELNEETGSNIVIDGLKSELENSYEEIKQELEESQKNIRDLNTNYEEKYKTFESEFKNKYKKINDDIAALMPHALTAGLSAAFSKKKDDEVASSNKLQIRFNTGIYLLIAVSTIPVALSVSFLIGNIPLEEVINRIPRLVLAIIPMYIPVLWLTYSANKKLNLSKRLIEEYSHKEALSKTYEGLSTQIGNIENPEHSEDLRFRLLSNFLQVSSENPGKLISNYEASDHPLMEALEQSYKFQMTIDKLEGIPGLSKVAAILERKAKKKIVQKEEVIDKALGNNGTNSTDENME